MDKNSRRIVRKTLTSWQTFYPMWIQADLYPVVIVVLSQYRLSVGIICHMVFLKETNYNARNLETVNCHKYLHNNVRKQQFAKITNIPGICQRMSKQVLYECKLDWSRNVLKFDIQNFRCTKSWQCVTKILFERKENIICYLRRAGKKKWLI